MKNTKCESKPRFLASEVLFQIDKTYPDNDILVVLGEIYSNTLKRSGISNEVDLLPANAWGLLYEDDDVGFIGKRIIHIGNAAVPYLYELLNNEEGVLYEGSEEATIGNSYQYRIKDIAAFYIAKIKNIPITYYKEFDKRDKEIERLKARMKTE